jgi:hypothetical protein
VGEEDKDKRRTWKGLRADGDCPTLAVTGSDTLARDTDARASAREEAKWRALFDAGLVDLEAVAEPRDEVKWSGCDEVEAHVLLRAKAGATIGAIVDGTAHPRAEVVRAVCRLIARGLLRFS